MNPRVGPGKGHLGPTGRALCLDTPISNNVATVSTRILFSEIVTLAKAPILECTGSNLQLHQCTIVDGAMGDENESKVRTSLFSSSRVERRETGHVTKLLPSSFGGFFISLAANLTHVSCASVMELTRHDDDRVALLFTTKKRSGK